MISSNKQGNENSCVISEIEIREFIADYLSKAEGVNGSEVIEQADDVDSIDYLQQGFVDSFGLMRFVFELEEAFKVEISPDDMAAPSFRSVGGVIQTIMSKLKEL